jgi:RP/EB family microtubule-associated protein
MKSKKLGRSELLTWVNKTVESDYIKIEDLSDGVGFCQIIDAFFKNISKEMNSLKLNAINEIELKQKNLCLLNTLLGKAGCIKHIDPNKLSKGLFSTNLEFLQFLFDFIYKTFGSSLPKKKYRGLKRRIEILKSQNGNKIFKNITKYLPSHLITNEVMLKIEKDKFFNESESDSDYTNEDELQIYEENNELQNKLDKYKLFFKLLEDDLIGYVDENKKLNEEMHDIEEEKDYFLGKLQNINIFCENQNNKSQNTKTKEHCTNIINIITNVPHDFQ